MTSQRIAQTNQQQNSEKLQVSGILQRAAIRPVSDAEVQSTDDQEVQPLSNSAFSKDFSRVPIRTTKPQQIMAKLTIGPVGDKYEQEADRVAAQVVQRINAPASVQSSENETVQREEMKTKDNEARLMRSPILQRRSTAGGMAATPDLETSINRARGGGQPMADNIRQPMEKAFGADFSGVKVHNDAQSSQLNQSIQAKAFTTRQDIFFRQGTYNPGSREGLELIAHELTHVVQQNGSTVQPQMANVAQRKGKPKEKVRRQPISKASGSHVIQRVTEKDSPNIFALLAPEYKMHFHKEIATFAIEDGTPLTVKDESLKNVYTVLESEALKEAKREKNKTKGLNHNELKAIRNTILEGWDVDTAVKKLTENADKLVIDSRPGREETEEEGGKPFINGGKIITFDTLVGEGTLEVIQNDRGVLLFAAHGFTNKSKFDDDDSQAEKAYGFMSGKYESVERSKLTKEKYKDMAEELQKSESDYKIKVVPDLVVYPHYSSDAIRNEGQLLASLVESMDIAILRNWKWKDTPEGKKYETAFINTVPLKFILGSSPLNKYNKYLMQVCRAHWSREVPVRGGSKQTSPTLQPWEKK